MVKAAKTIKELTPLADHYHWTEILFGVNAMKCFNRMKNERMFSQMVTNEMKLEEEYEKQLVYEDNTLDEYCENWFGIADMEYCGTDPVKDEKKLFK